MSHPEATPAPNPSSNQITPSHQKKILLLTCEHAVNTIPKIYQPEFKDYAASLTSHLGFDIGAQRIARYLQAFFGCDLFEATISRLLIDCNRSLNNPSCFSNITKSWSSLRKKEITQSYYLPYRTRVIDTMDNYIHQGYQLWHLSIHSFTPCLDNKVRNADIGLLYDPKRTLEKKLASEWQEALKQEKPTLRVRMNYPYLGKSNGFTTSLRKRYHAIHYLGLEIETNQLHLQNSRSIKEISHSLALSLRFLCKRNA